MLYHLFKLFHSFFSLLWYGSPGGILRQVIWKKKKLPMHVWITRWTKIDIFPLVLDARWGRNLLLMAICALNGASPVNGQHLFKRSKKGWRNLLISTCISHQIMYWHTISTRTIIYTFLSICSFEYIKITLLKIHSSHLISNISKFPTNWKKAN